LENVFLKHDSELGDRAERVLQAYSRSDQPIAALAQAVLIRNGRIRETRARRAITKLGGEVVYIHPNPQVPLTQVPLAVISNSAVAPGTGVGFGEPAVLYAVWLHETWKGGEEGLWHLERLQHWEDIAVYSIRGNNVSRLALFRLAGIVRGLQFVERGPCLGIQNDRDDSRCFVGDVLPGSAAQSGGLRMHDEILKLNGEHIPNFPNLVQRLQDFEVGDTIQLLVRRLNSDNESESIELKIKLTSWRTVTRSEIEVPAPRPFRGPFESAPSVPPPVPTPERLDDRMAI
ncbi:MAG: PDZ domain-containing protein, partial [Planctomycetaceae bacterium]|nr:PDZ domain-containing protein [Planctomycetaceae bacterium]